MKQKNGDSYSFFSVLVLEWIDWSDARLTVYKGPFVMPCSLDAGAWQFATTVPEPTKLQERCKMEYQSLFWTGSQVLIEPFLWTGYNCWVHEMTRL